MGKASRLKKLRLLQAQYPTREGQQALATPRLAHPEDSETEWEGSEQTLVERHRRSDLGQDAIIIKAPRGVEKMSDILGEFAEPFFEGANTFEEQQKSIAFAALVWNMSLLPEAERMKPLQESPITKLTPELMPFIEQMIRRKHALFPDVNRFILNYEITDTGDGLHLDVISSLPEQVHAKT